MGVKFGCGFEWGALTAIITSIDPVANDLGGIAQTKVGTTQGTIKKTGSLALKMDYGSSALKTGTATGVTASTLTDSGGGFNAAGIVDGSTRVFMGGSLQTIQSHTDTVLTLNASWINGTPSLGAYAIGVMNRAKFNPGDATGAANKCVVIAAFKTACFLAYLYVPNYPRNVGGELNIFAFTAAAGVARRIYWYANGTNTTLRVMTNGVVQGTSGTLTPGTWIAVKWLTATGAGFTAQQDTLWIDSLRPQGYVFSGAGSSSVSDTAPILGDDGIIGAQATWYCDDLTIMDEDVNDKSVNFAGNIATLWADGRFPLQVPTYYPFFPITGAPTYDQWTKSTGTTAWDLIDEPDAQTLTDYVQVPVSTPRPFKQSWRMQTVTTVGVPAGLRPALLYGLCYMAQTSVSNPLDWRIILGGVEYTGAAFLGALSTATWWRMLIGQGGGWYNGQFANYVTRAKLDNVWEVEFDTLFDTQSDQTVTLYRFTAEIMFIDPRLESLAWGS